MARRTIDDDFSEQARKDAHVLLDTLFDLKLASVVAGKQAKGGFMWRIFGDKRGVAALTRKLADMAEKGTI